jgi:catechol 2,3-dioxygenase-like lactoylglutathione lyase family enzyme
MRQSWNGDDGVWTRGCRWNDYAMRINREIIVFDTADLTAESAFWAGILGGAVEADDDDWHTVYVDGKPRLGFQLAPDHTPPEWPDGNAQQIHLDFYVDDVKTAHDEAMSLGARLLKPADDMESAEGFQVYASPAGHPFCLCWT